MNSRATAIRSAELVTSDLLPECPDCHEYAHPSATVCEGCGTHLFLQAASGRPFTLNGPHGCTCGGNGVCTVCVIALYDEGLPL